MKAKFEESKHLTSESYISIKEDKSSTIDGEEKGIFVIGEVSREGGKRERVI
jgi:hypothetical protein